MQHRRRIILHVDLDAFYVAVEANKNPTLKGVPVVVGADPEGGKGRGVVVACSYEARKFGLGSGMPISRAWKLCPTAAYLRPNFELYERTSEQVMSCLRQYADEFEQTSIDEAFLDVSRRVTDLEEAKELALMIKDTIRTKFQLTCSVGIGPNKSTAKIASDRRKPDGLTTVSLERPAEFLGPLPVSVIPGVGKKTQRFLKERRVETINQLQQLEGRQLLKWFGKTGVWLWGVVHGQEDIPVRSREMPKSLSVERTFREDLKDFVRVYQEAEGAAGELIGRIRQGGFQFRVAGIKVRFTGFETHTREKSLPGYTDSGPALVETSRSLLHEFSSRGKPVRLVGVRVSKIRRNPFQASTLDSWTPEA